MSKKVFNGLFGGPSEDCQALKYSILDSVSANDPLKLTKLLISYFNRKYNMSSSDVFEMFSKEQNSTSNIFIPVTLFANILSPAESLVTYLKENLNFKFSEIAKLINRDERSLWGNYNRSKDKGSLIIEKTPYLIPLELFQDRSLSVLEHIVLYLKENYNLNVQTISKLINKKSTTVWSVFNRIKKKAELDEVHDE